MPPRQSVDIQEATVAQLNDLQRQNAQAYLDSAATVTDRINHIIETNAAPEEVEAAKKLLTKTKHITKTCTRSLETLRVGNSLVDHDVENPGGLYFVLAFQPSTVLDMVELCIDEVVAMIDIDGTDDEKAIAPRIKDILFKENRKTVWIDHMLGNSQSRAL